MTTTPHTRTRTFTRTRWGVRQFFTEVGVRRTRQLRGAVIALIAGAALCVGGVVPAAADEPSQGLTRDQFVALVFFSNPTCEQLKETLPQMGVHTELDLINTLRVINTPAMTNAPGDPFARAHALVYATTVGSRAVSCGAVTPVPFAPVMGSSGYFSS